MAKTRSILAQLISSCTFIIVCSQWKCLWHCLLHKLKNKQPKAILFLPACSNFASTEKEKGQGNWWFYTLSHLWDVIEYCGGRRWSPRATCVFSRVQQGTPVLTYKGCTLQRVSLSALRDLTVVLVMRQKYRCVSHACDMLTLVPPICYVLALTSHKKSLDVDSITYSMFKWEYPQLPCQTHSFCHHLIIQNISLITLQIFKPFFIIHI